MIIYKRSDDKMAGHNIKNLFAALTLLVGMTNVAEARDLKLGTNIWPGYEPFYFSQNHMPDFASTDIEIKRYFNASEVRAAFELGLIDVAALTLDEAIMAADRGLDLSIIALIDVSDGADKICTTLPEFDVKNARVAYEDSALGGYFLSEFIQHLNVALGDFETVENMSVDIHLGALEGNEANTFVTFEPFASLLEAEGCREIYNSSYEPYMITDVLLLNNDQLASGDVSVDQIQDLLNAWFWAVSKLHAQDSFAMTEIAKGLGVSSSELVEIYTELKVPDMVENLDLLGSEVLADRLEVTHEFLRKMQRVKSVTHFDDISIKFEPKYLIALD